MTPTENRHCNRQNCFDGSEPCELGDIEIFQNGKKIGTNSVCLKLYDVDIDTDKFQFQSQGSTDNFSNFAFPWNLWKCDGQGSLYFKFYNERNGKYSNLR